MSLVADDDVCVLDGGEVGGLDEELLQLLDVGAKLGRYFNGLIMGVAEMKVGKG